jgi:gas vesicle protein
MASDDRNSGTSGVLLSFVLGALSGAALAILFAPRSGRETREILGDKLRETAERSRRFGEQTVEQAVEKGREVAEEASSYLDRQREALERRRDRLAAAVEAGRQAYREEKEKT